MTATPILMISCDGPGCEYPEAHWPVMFEPYTNTELRRLLAAHRGWTRPRIDGRLIDLCADCTTHRLAPAA